MWRYSATSFELNFNPRFPRGKRHKAAAKNATPKISIHASRGGSDPYGGQKRRLPFAFQSTLPVGEATRPRSLSKWFPRFQSTLPTGEATMLTIPEWCIYVISIHASREGSDNFDRADMDALKEFQSTLPAKEATRFIIVGTCDFLISIHTSREGSDAL